MSNTITIACRPLRLSPAQKSVLMCLADYCHDDGKDWHSIAAITAWTCHGRRTVIDALKVLEARGLIVVERTSGKLSTTHLQLDRIKAQAEADEQANPCGSRTRANAAPVQEPHDTRAGAAPPPVQEPHDTSAAAAPEALVSIKKHQVSTR